MKLVWSTNQDSLVRNFSIEKMVGNSSFKQVATVFKNSSSPGEYSWEDEIQYNENIYYRIKLWKQTGDVLVSSTISYSKSALPLQYSFNSNTGAIIVECKNRLIQPHKIVINSLNGMALLTKEFAVGYSGKTEIFLPRPAIMGHIIISTYKGNNRISSQLAYHK